MGTQDDLAFHAGIFRCSEHLHHFARGALARLGRMREPHQHVVARARGADGIMTGYAFPEMLVGVCKLMAAGQRDAALAPGSEGAHICAVVPSLPSCPLGSIVWSAALQAFLATSDCSLQAGAQFYVAASADLLTWSAPARLYGRGDLPANVSSEVTAMAYPVLLDVAAPDAGGRRRALITGGAGYVGSLLGRRLAAGA